MSSQPRRHRLRCGLTNFLVTALCFSVLAVVGWHAYVRPQVDALRRADAIFVLGGDGPKRYAFGLDLAKQGFAPNLVWSVEEGPRSEWTNTPDWMKQVCDAQSFVKGRTVITVRCIGAHPHTTLGEGRELRRLATEFGWRTVIVVTYRPHVSRARFILKRCFSGELIMVESPADITWPEWLKQFPYQSAGYVKSLFVGSRC